MNAVNDDMVISPVGDLVTDEDTDLAIEICVEDVDVATNGQVIDFNEGMFTGCEDDSDDLFSLSSESSDCSVN